MEPAMIMLGALIVVGTVLWLLDRRNRGHDAEGNEVATEAAETESACSDACCGTHEVCPSEQLLRGELCEITYYDDEELDSFRGRGANDYSEAELEQWRDVLYTLQPADRLGWERSVKRRGIVLPSAIREELIMLIQEAGLKAVSRKP